VDPDGGDPVQSIPHPPTAGSLPTTGISVRLIEDDQDYSASDTMKEHVQTTEHHQLFPAAFFP
jgi:hypothetical protein